VSEAKKIAEKLERRTVCTVRTKAVYVRLQVIGEHGGVEFHFACYPEPISQYYGENSWNSMGVEAHWKAHSKPDYFKNDACSHPDCSITGGECWHDGTSLWASEYWMPNFLDGGPEWAFDRLEQYYREVFADCARELEARHD